MSTDTKKFYIFPLTNINLFPNTTKPLNIFEPRYVEMVNQSIQLGIPIALCFVPEGSHEIRPVAGFAVPQVIERRADGTMLVFMAGQGKAQLNLNTIKTEDLVSSMEGTVVNEDKILDENLRAKYVALSEVLVRWVTSHISDPLQRETFIKSLKGPQEVIGAFSAYLIYDYDLQYEMMEITSLNEQIKFLYRLLESGKLTNV
ncbi:LON peptidase substrate-binding domain-containing protein [bacterium]|nr:LON peptidase substrate-binding domain-containing protein [bacterium]